MSLQTLEQPRSIILSEIHKQTIKLPQINSIIRTQRRICLQSIKQRTNPKRIHTQPDLPIQNSALSPQKPLQVSKLRSVLKISHSSILSTLSTKLTAIEKLNLVQGGAVRHVLYSGHIRIPTVHNDYHSSKTNAGYSRNKYGGIYPK